MKKKSETLAPGCIRVRVKLHSYGGEYAGTLVVREAEARALIIKGAFKAGRLLSPTQLESLRITYDTSISVEAP